MKRRSLGKGKLQRMMFLSTAGEAIPFAILKLFDNMRKLLNKDVGVTAGAGLLRVDAIRMVNDKIVETTTKK